MTLHDVTTHVLSTQIRKILKQQNLMDNLMLIQTAKSEAPNKGFLANALNFRLHFKLIYLFSYFWGTGVFTNLSGLFLIHFPKSLIGVIASPRTFLVPNDIFVHLHSNESCFLVSFERCNVIILVTRSVTLIRSFPVKQNCINLQKAFSF